MRKPSPRVRAELLVLLIGCLITSCQNRNISLNIPTHFDSSQAIARTRHVELHRHPSAAQTQKLTQSAESIIKAVHLWLPPKQKPQALRLMVYAPDEPEGQALLKASATKHRATGFFLREQNTILLVGDPDDPRFWTVLRHEAAHHALQASTKRSIPFWLEEGVASFYEEGVDSNGTPRDNPERRIAATHYAKQRQGLKLEDLLNHPSPKRQDGRAYAEAWATIRYLFQNHRSQAAQWILSGDELAPFGAERFVKEAPLDKASLTDFERLVTESLLKP